MATNIFQSNNAFIACEHLGQKEAFYTTEMTGSIASAVQSSAFDVSLSHIAPKQVGSSRLAFNSLNRQPDVRLQFSYYLNYPFFNEGFVNLVDLNNATVTGMAEIPSVGALSGIENASRNFYILTRPDQGFDALSGFIEGDSPSFSGYQCASVGNCFLTDYSLSYGVGALPTVSVEFLGSNMQYEEVTGQTLSSPAINLQSGNAHNVGHLSFGPIAEFDQTPIVMNPVEAGSSVTLQNFQVGGQAISGNHALQNVSLNLNIPRVASYGLGSDYVYNRKAQLPARGSVNLSSLVSGFSAGVLSGVLANETSYNFDLVLETSGKSISYGIEDAKLQSYNYSMAVNDIMSLDASFSFELYSNPKGLQMQGNPQESLALHCSEQIASRITDSMTSGVNAPMFVDFTNPSGTVGGGGYGAARSGDFWASDIDLTCASVWNNKGYPYYGANADYRMIGAVAITPRHVAWAKHFMLDDGNKVWFVEPDGTWIERTLTEGRSHATVDIAVGLLNSDLPSTISIPKVFPEDVDLYVNTGTSTVATIENYYRPMALALDHRKMAHCVQVSKIVGLGTTNFMALPPFNNPAVGPKADNFAWGLQTGDSGQQAYAIVDGTAVLLTCFHRNSTGPSYARYRTDINTLIAGVDSDAGIDTGYQLEALDLAPYNFKRYRLT